MRERVDRQQSMFVAFDLEQFVPEDHPLRQINRWADGLLAGMSRDFDRAYGKTGRPGVPPERLLKALLFQAALLDPQRDQAGGRDRGQPALRWFLDLPLEEDAWTQEAFSMNRQRFELHDLCRKFFDRVVAEGIERSLIGPDHFTADGTLIRSLASQKRLKPIVAGLRMGTSNRISLPPEGSESRRASIFRSRLGGVQSLQSAGREPPHSAPVQ